MTNSISWHEKEIDFSELKPYKYNPRRISKEQFSKLEQAIEEDGYHQRLLIDADYTIIGGHQRYQYFRMKGSEKIKVLMPSRKLTAEEFKKINIRDNGAYGEFDLDILTGQFDPLELLDMPIPEFIMNDLITEEDVDTSVKKDKKLTVCPNCKHEF